MNSSKNIYRVLGVSLLALGLLVLLSAPVLGQDSQQGEESLSWYQKLNSPEGLAEQFDSNPVLFFAAVFALGVAVSLTPCVLPMIPINLSIIGAGAHASSRIQGFVRGTAYGLGMALAYGSLGLFTVLTGAKFGSLNSLSWFNFVVAIIFVVLALAMFDFFTIDLSRFSSRFGGVSSKKRGRLISAFTMGVVAALLAGACVAPIVIAVLLHSATLYAGGQVFGLFLPLLLGLGMAIPWPIAGAGLTVLPRPGAWMVHIKHAFAVLLILFGLYYAYLGVGLMPSSETSDSTGEAIADLRSGLEDALHSHKPVLIDFWASWCKNCLKMDATTFKDPRVAGRLEDFSEIKFRAEKPNDPRIKGLMDRYGLVGLPGYVWLNPKRDT
jgi:thiol:disulfide interchange protein DsbD